MTVGRSTAPDRQNIYLVGFMGAGKTTVGRLLTERLNRPFYDTDGLIEQRTGKTISQIFEKHGENYFRMTESEVIRETAKSMGAIIALGGGAIMHKENWQVIQKTGRVVYLKWDPDTLLSRIVSDKSRPLVFREKASQRRERLEQLFEKRKANYERADIIINCHEGIFPGEIVEQILYFLPEAIR